MRWQEKNNKEQFPPFLNVIANKFDEGLRYMIHGTARHGPPTSATSAGRDWKITRGSVPCYLDLHQPRFPAFRLRSWTPKYKGNPVFVGASYHHTGYERKAKTTLTFLLRPTRPARLAYVNVGAEDPETQQKLEYDARWYSAPVSLTHPQQVIVMNVMQRHLVPSWFGDNFKKRELERCIVSVRRVCDQKSYADGSSMHAI